MVRLSRRVESIIASPTFRMVQLKNRLLAEGKKIFDFGAGEPDFITPAHIKEAGVKAIQTDFTRYTRADGISDLKAAIRFRYMQEQGYDADEEKIFFAPGSKYALFSLLQAVVEADDEVILPRPYWVSYPEMVRFCGAVPVFADHGAQNPLFAVTAESFIAMLSPRTRAVIVNSPANPTGKIMAAEELARLIDVCASRGVLLIVDDCYRQICFIDEYPSPLKLRPDAAEHVAVVSSLSKSYSMTGWRAGYVISDKRICAAMTRMAEHSVSNTCTITQKAAIEALCGDQSFLEVRMKEYRIRRDIITRSLDKISMFSYTLPEGAFYIFADASKAISLKGAAGDEGLAMAMLDSLGIITIPGSAFGAPGYLRLSFATPAETIREGLSKLGAWLQGNEMKSNP